MQRKLQEISNSAKHVEIEIKDPVQSSDFGLDEPERLLDCVASEVVHSVITCALYST